MSLRVSIVERGVERENNPKEVKFQIYSFFSLGAQWRCWEAPALFNSLNIIKSQEPLTRSDVRPNHKKTEKEMWLGIENTWKKIENQQSFTLFDAEFLYILGPSLASSKLYVYQSS